MQVDGLSTATFFMFMGLDEIQSKMNIYYIRVDSQKNTGLPG